MVRDNRAECVKNTCPGVEVLFRNGKCYPYDELTNVLPSKLTREEFVFIERQLPPAATYSSGTFTNCVKEDSNGICLESVALAEVKEQEDQEFIILRSQLFPEIDNDIK